MEIKQSSIHGRGVFATQHLKAGEKLFQYIGEEMSLKKFREKFGIVGIVYREFKKEK
jgi:SET domain-containing protein